LEKPGLRPIQQTALRSTGSLKLPELLEAGDAKVTMTFWIVCVPPFWLEFHQERATGFAQNPGEPFVVISLPRLNESTRA